MAHTGSRSWYTLIDGRFRSFSSQFLAIRILPKEIGVRFRVYFLWGHFRNHDLLVPEPENWIMKKNTLSKDSFFLDTFRISGLAPVKLFQICNFSSPWPHGQAAYIRKANVQLGLKYSYMDVSRARTRQIGKRLSPVPWQRARAWHERVSSASRDIFDTNTNRRLFRWKKCRMMKQ
jgi:hypothetical protein